MEWTVNVVDGIYFVKWTQYDTEGNYVAGGNRGFTSQRKYFTWVKEFTQLYN